MIGTAISLTEKLALAPRRRPGCTLGSGWAACKSVRAVSALRAKEAVNAGQ